VSHTKGFIAVGYTRFCIHRSSSSSFWNLIFNSSWFLCNDLIQHAATFKVDKISAYLSLWLKFLSHEIFFILFQFRFFCCFSSSTFIHPINAPIPFLGRTASNLVELVFFAFLLNLLCKFLCFRFFSSFTLFGHPHLFLVGKIFGMP
jgi:hypothetical protein